jgi:hypothetical protein
LIALFVLAPREAKPQESPWLDLTWRAPPSCPPGPEIEREITRLVGSAPRDKGMLKATVDVAGSDDRVWRARVRSEYGGEIGERSLEGTTCRAVARAAALVVALTVDSHAGEEPLPPPRVPDLVLPPPPSPSPPPPRPRTHRWYVLLGPRSEAGLLPRPGVGAGIGVGIRFPVGSLEVTAAAYAPENFTVAGTATGGRFTLISAGARLCPRIVGAAIDLLACVTAEFDRLSAEGFGVTTPDTAATNLATFGVGPRVDFFPSRSLHLNIGVDANFTPGRANFVLQPLGKVRSIDPLGGSARIDLAWYF